MAKRTKQQAQQEEPGVPASPSEYERGLMDGLELVLAVIGEMGEELRPPIVSGARTAIGSYLAGSAGAAQNLLGAVRAEVERRTIRAALEARNATSPAPAREW